MEVKDVLLRRQAVVQPVPQLVRQHSDVAQLPREVQHHIGVVLGCHRHAVRAARLARHHRRIDPPVFEEVLNQRSGLLGEAVISAEHHLPRLLPRHVPRRLLERRVPIPLVQVADPHQLSLDSVIPHTDVVPARHRLDQCLHRLVRGLIREVSRRDPRRELAQSVVDRLLLQDDVEDVGARADVAPQRHCDGATGSTPDLAVGLAQLRQRLLEGHLPPVQVDPNARAKLLEQPGPGRVAHRAVVGEDALLRLRKLVRPELAGLFDRVRVLRRLLVRVQARGLLVARLRQLEGEEDPMASALGAGLAYPRQQPPGRRILGVLAVKEVGVHLRLGRRVLVLLELAHHRCEVVRVQGRDPALVLGLERLRPLQRARQGSLDLGVGRRGVEIAQVPANRFGACFLHCFCHGGSG